MSSIQLVIDKITPFIPGLEHFENLPKLVEGIETLARLSQLQSVDISMTDQEKLKTILTELSPRIAGLLQAEQPIDEEKQLLVLRYLSAKTKIITYGYLGSELLLIYKIQSYVELLCLTFLQGNSSANIGKALYLSLSIYTKLFTRDINREEANFIEKWDEFFAEWPKVTADNSLIKAYLLYLSLKIMARKTDNELYKILKLQIRIINANPQVKNIKWFIDMKFQAFSQFLECCVFRIDNEENEVEKHGLEQELRQAQNDVFETFCALTELTKKVLQKKIKLNALIYYVL